jgi:glycosyltransferase 2 family protein
VKSKLKAIVPLAATAFFLWWALKDVEWALAWTNFKRANLFYFGAALVVATLSIHVRALRWKVMLEPVAPNIPLHPRMAGTAVGLAANNTLPARAGEFARALVCARLARLPVASVFGSLALERVLDGIALVTMLLAVIAIEGFPGQSEAVLAAKKGAVIVSLMGLVLAIGLGLLAAFPHRFVALVDRVAARVLPERWRRPLVDALHAFLGGLAVLRSPRLLTLSVLWAYGQWLFFGVGFWLAFKAFGIDTPGYGGALFLQSCIGLAVAIPTVPGFAGVWHWAAVQGLGLYGVDATQAASFAIAYHLGGWITVTAVGLYYFSRLGLTVRDLMGAEEKVEEAVEDEDPTALPDA